MRKELRDQLAHAGYCTVVLLPAMLWPNPLTGGLGGFGLGFLREITEEGKVSWYHIKRAARGRDMFVWTGWGTVLGAVVWVLRTAG